MFKHRLILRLLLFFIWFILIFFSFIFNKNRTSISDWNIIFVVDISNSMNVKDVFYNSIQISRLNLVKKIIENNIKKIDKPVWFILISSKLKYFIPPTKDKDIFLTYLNTVNTNTIRWWESNLKESLEKLNNLVDFTDKVIVFSDFDTKDNLNWIKFNFTPYFIWIWTNLWWNVKDKDDKNIYLQWELLKSSLNENKIKHLGFKYKIIDSYEKDTKLDYLYENNFSLIKKWNINILQYIWFWLVLLWL